MYNKSKSLEAITCLETYESLCDLVNAQALQTLCFSEVVFIPLLLSTLCTMGLETCANLFCQLEAPTRNVATLVIYFFYCLKAYCSPLFHIR